jgi:peptidoglycan/LPS O-acetylase OafA/YrhL
MGEKLGYRPALDGLRAVSIALVLVFHLGAPWLPGGYLGVSVFFTLSGFLITSLLLSERAGTGRIDVGAFYVRRLRRLLPASLVCLTGIAVLASIGTIAARSDLRAGVLGAVFQVANWEHLLGHRSYADLFLAPSPVDHFWSLAIEEQFYWMWPLVIAALTAVAARRVASVLVAAFAALAAGAFVTAQVLGGDAAYFASWARFAEILAGAALAALVHGRQVPARASRLALPCLVAIVVLAVLTPAGRGWAYEGGLPLFALVSAGLLLGLLAPGPIATLLAREPIPWVGRISYGLYLFHWPVFTVLGDASVGEKLAMTGGLTVVSYYVIERPIRTGRVLSIPSRYLRGAAVGFVTVAAVAAVIVPDVHVARRSTAPQVIAAVGASSTPPTTTVSSSVIGSISPLPSTDEAAPTTTSTTVAPAPTVVALFGDSVADWLMRDAAPTFARTDVTLVDAAVEGCDGAAGIPAGHGRNGVPLPLPADCRTWSESYVEVVEDPDRPVDVAVLMVGYAPMVDRQVGGSWIGPCDSLSWYVDDIGARVAYLRAHVDRVVLAVPSWGGSKASFLSSEDHLARMACIRQALTDFAARSDVDTVDLAALLCPAGPQGACPALRDSDGVHVDPDDAPAVLEWLLDRVV